MELRIETVGTNKVSLCSAVKDNIGLYSQKQIKQWELNATLSLEIWSQPNVFSQGNL